MSQEQLIIPYRKKAEKTVVECKICKMRRTRETQRTWETPKIRMALGGTSNRILPNQENHRLVLLVHPFNLLVLPQQLIKILRRKRNELSEGAGRVAMGQEEVAQLTLELETRTATAPIKIQEAPLLLVNNKSTTMK